MTRMLYCITDRSIDLRVGVSLAQLDCKPVISFPVDAVMSRWYYSPTGLDGYRTGYPVLSSAIYAYIVALEIERHLPLETLQFYARKVRFCLPNKTQSAVLWQSLNGNLIYPKNNSKSTVENAIQWEDTVEKERILRISGLLLISSTGLLDDWMRVGSNAIAQTVGTIMRHNITNLRRLK